MTTFGAILVAATTMLGQTDVEQSPLPEAVAKQMDYFVGTWTVEGEVRGLPLKGRWNAKWSPMKHCLLITYPLNLDGEEILGHGIMGWDTEKEEVLVFSLYSSGVFEDGRYKLASPGLMKGNFVGSAQGEPFEATAEVRTDQPDKWTFHTEGNTVGGKKEGELSVTFIRAKAKPKPKKEKGN